MSAYKSFAIAGVGTLGEYVLDGLATAKKEGKIDSLIVLSRSAEGNAKAKALGIECLQVDYADASALTSVLKGVDVLVSTLGPFGLGLQPGIADAAKVAGVKLFVPAEYGAPAIDMGGGKSALRRKLGEMGLPFVIFFVGVFMHTFFSPGMKMDLHSGKVTVGGSGDNPITFTTVKDIGAYVAHCLTTLPPSKLEGATILIEGDRAGIKEVIAGYEKSTGKKVEVDYVSVESMKESAAKNPYDFFSLQWLATEEGRGVIGAEDEVNLYKFPGWEPVKAIDFVLSGGSA